MDGQGKEWTLLMGIWQGLDPVPVCPTYRQCSLELTMITIVIIIINNSNSYSIYKERNGILRLAECEAFRAKPGPR